MLQAAAGAWLVRRFIRDRWQILMREHEIFMFFLLGGPLSCVISASVAQLTLFFSALSVQPIFPGRGGIGGGEYLWGAGLRATIAGFSWQATLLENAQGLIAPITLILVVLIVAGFVNTAKLENRQQQAEIQGIGQNIAFQLQERFNAYNETLSALRRLVELSPDMGFRQFDYFTREILKESQGISGFSYNYFVRDRDRYSTSSKPNLQMPPANRST